MGAPLKKVGLFGGSFNPPHAGNLYISDAAMDKLGLDEIWWIVSRKNPLKSETTLAPFLDRFESATALAADHPIKVLDIEEKEGLQYSIDTVRHLRAAHPDINFAWVMGADCFANLHSWKNWRELMGEIPFAVFRREGFTKAALDGKAATEFSEKRIPESKAKNLVVTTPPAWVYIDIEPILISATEIRGRQQG